MLRYLVCKSFECAQSVRKTLFDLEMSNSVSGGYSIAYGLIGDLTTPAERGGFTGTISVL